MHGTFRSHVERGAVTTVRFDAPVARPRPWRSTLAALLAGCCLAALPSAPRLLAPEAQAPTPARAKPNARRVALASPAPRPEVKRERRHLGSRVSNPVARPATIRIVLPDPVPVMVDIAPPSRAVAVAVGTPPKAETTSSASAPPPPASTLAVAVPPPALPPAANAPRPLPVRPVDIAQISDSEVHSLNVPELQEPGLAAGSEPTLSSKIAAMQVTPPPPVRLRDSDRATLLAEAPTQMTVRIGGSALGKVDFRMSDARTIDVRLGNLLDLLSGHYGAAEFARLRTSAAADAYVSFDQLRALGLNVRYNPAYDEIQITG